MSAIPSPRRMAAIASMFALMLIPACGDDASGNEASDNNASDAAGATSSEEEAGETSQEAASTGGDEREPDSESTTEPVGTLEIDGQTYQLAMEPRLEASMQKCAIGDVPSIGGLVSPDGFIVGAAGMLGHWGVYVSDPDGKTVWTASNDPNLPGLDTTMETSGDQMVVWGTWDAQDRSGATAQIRLEVICPPDFDPVAAG